MRLPKWFKRLAILIIVVHIIGIGVNFVLFKAEFWDNDENRGANEINSALFEADHSTPTYLDQGWTNRESLWFYKTSQGSNLLPYDFYMVLEQEEQSDLFRSDKNIQKYRYLTRKATFSNPDALPIGFAKDSYKGKDYLGFTCAACHTSQINYIDKDSKNRAIRIDGGPGQSDFDSFMNDLSTALQDTLANVRKRDRFVKVVLERNGLDKMVLGGRNYTSEEEVIEDLQRFTRRIITYNWINRSDVSYGFSRLDAFGRLYNRILEHVVDEKTLKKVLHSFLPDGEANDVYKKVIEMDNISHLVDETLNILTEKKKSLNLLENQSAQLEHLNIKSEYFFDELFQTANAPVSFPYLWDVPFHDYLQWNGIVNNAGGGALGRNIGQVIGVFGTLDWKKTDDFSPSSYLIENKSVLEEVSFHSSINMRNISRVETLLRKLTSPKWPEDELGEINPDMSFRGKIIFQEYCQDCHAQINRDDPKRRISANFTSLEKVGTDPKMALNSINSSGYTGLLQGSYVDVPVGKLLLQEKAPVTLLVATSTENTIKTPDMDSNILVRWSDWIYDLLFVLFDNPVENTVKQGIYNPDTTVEPFASLLAYKARPLNGIWATAPYLHNGSIPTLYDLLLPQKERPSMFKVGSREFDKEKVGFVSDGYNGFEFDTTQEGNYNTGHEYASGKTALPDGKKLKPLNEQQRYDLIEYLKSL